MSDYQDNYSSSNNTLAKLHICLLSNQQELSDSIANLLNSDRYRLNCVEKTDELADFIVKNYEQIDCLILFKNAQLDPTIKQLWQSEILLPTVIIEVEQQLNISEETSAAHNNFSVNTAVKTIYHQAELRLYPTQLAEVNSYINLAITKFINLAPDSKSQHSANVKKSLIAQQRRLTSKLKERLSYLRIFYKRDSRSFYRNLSSEEQQKLNYKFSQDYRRILLDYFDNDFQVNKLIDEFVDQAFFADISTSQILEIHMELIDDFSQQLKIEKRNEDILLDYRLPLIDVISHLCEMYRRSIPGEDISLELLFTVE